ncbi:MAG: hypothetical protein ABUL50_06795, partial [Rhizobacter sp.]
NDHAQAEHFMLQALGLTLQRPDDVTVQRRLTNLLYLAQLRFDAARGDETAAARALVQCARFVVQGDRLARRACVYQQCLWRSNRAGWLRRRGLLVEAIAEYDAICLDADKHGWVVLARNARLDQALALRERGRPLDAIAVLSQLAANEHDADSYDVKLQAHELLRDMLAAAGRKHEAAAHAEAHAMLLQQRGAAHAALLALLPQADVAIDAAIAEADRLRFDAQAERSREAAASARNQRFLDSRI